MEGEPRPIGLNDDLAVKFEVGIGLVATLARGAVAFNDISAAEWVRNAQPGWNLGNTLDAYPDEGSWNNPPVQPSTFDYLKTAGFKGVRIPGTISESQSSLCLVDLGD